MGASFIDVLGGGMMDRFGRKFMVLFSLVFSALSMLVMGLAQGVPVFILGMLIVGLLANAPKVPACPNQRLRR